MTRPIEDRLRAAFRARAEEVKASDLTRSYDEIAGDTSGDDGPTDIFTGRPERARRTRPSEHRRWLVPAAAAAAVVALVGGGFLLSDLGRDDTTLPPATQSATGPRVVASTPVAGEHAREATRSEIPWASVGQGWTAAVWTRTAAADGASLATLYLVSPSGIRYAVGQVTASTRVLDVAPDGRRILVRDLGPDPVEWDVITGVSRTISLGGGDTPDVRYTKPAGKALRLTYIASGLRMERRSLDGTIQIRYPAVPTQSSGGEAALETPDGLGFVVPTTGGMALVGNAQGSVVRTFRLPLGRAACAPVSWWSEGIMLARCQNAKNTVPVLDLWTFSLSGAPASRLTTADGSRPLGYLRGWASSAGTVVQEGSDCGTGGPLALLDALHIAQPLTVRFPNQPTGSTLTVLAVKDEYAFLTTTGCQPTGEGAPLVAYNLLTKQATFLLGPGVNDGDVVSAVVIDSAR